MASAQAVPDPSVPRQSAKLQLFLLGPPSAVHKGQPLVISRLQVRLLLYRLGLLEPVSREELLLLFWPDLPDAVARRNLTQLLSHLRRALPSPGLLLTTQHQILLDPDRVWSDVATFQYLCSDKASTRRDNVRDGVALYRGRFLEGVDAPGSAEYEEWLTVKQRGFEHLYLKALALLIDDSTDQGAHREAISLARRYLEVDELAEGIHRRLVQLYAATGDRSAALQQYQQCSAILERELGVAPMPETQEVYRAVLAGEAALIEPPVDSKSVRDSLPGWNRQLVGREAVIQQVDSLYQQAQGGQGQVLLLSGEMGVGKSRFLQELVTRFRRETFVLSGATHPSTQGMPYQPLIEMVRPALRSAPLSAIHATWLMEASQLLPELPMLVPDLPQSKDVTAHQARGHLFEALRQLILGLAQQRFPPLLCLDDLHWADPTTLNWLAYLARHMHSEPFLVIGTYRSEEMAVLSTLRGELRRLGLLSEIHLSAFDLGETRELVRTLVDSQAVDDAVVSRLQKATGGNPFFLLETVQALLESGQIPSGFANIEALPLPDTVREALQARLERLRPVTGQVLEAGAVLGPTWTFQLVQETAGRSEMETLDALEELVTRHLLVEEEGAYRFRHEQIRSVVYHGLSYWRRRLLHRRAAEALERLHGSSLRSSSAPSVDGIVAQLGHHYAEAGEEEEAVHYLVRAGDSARNLYAHPEAIAHYQSALALLGQQGEYEQSARVLMKLGLTHHTAFDFVKARHAYEEAFSLWRRPRSASSPTLPANPSALRLAINEPLSLDPAMFTDTFSAMVCDQLFSGLVALNAESDIVPDVAYRWEVSEGGRVYKFHLRDDVYWSDGRPLTAGDFVYAWRRVLDPATASPNASLLYVIRGARQFHRGDVADAESVAVRALDAYTLLVELEEPTSYFPFLLAYNATYAVPQHAVTTLGNRWTEADHIVTNGPYKMQERRHGRSMELVRNENYHGIFGGNVQRAELRFDVASFADQLAMYEAGNLDILWLWGAMEERERARQRHAEEYLSVPLLLTYYVGFDVNRRPFDDPRVRRALALSIEQQILADVILRGYDVPASGGLLPPGMPGHIPDIGRRYKPDEGRQLLADAGYPGGSGFPQVEALTFAGIQNPMMEYLRTQWQEQLNINIDWKMVDFRTLGDRRRAGDPPHLYITARQPRNLDPGLWLLPGYAEGWTRWNSERYDDLLRTARLSTAQQERIALYQEAQRLLADETLVVPLTYGRTNLLVKPRVRQLPVSPIKVWFLKDIFV